MKPMKVKRRRSSGFSPFIITVAAAAVFSAVVAGIWQLSAPAPIEDPGFSPSASSVPSEPSSLQEKVSSEEEGASSAVGAVGPAGGDSTAPEPTGGAVGQGEVEFGKPVPELARVTSSYFDDAVFVGDSITTGISAYDVMSNTTVIASTGVNLDSIFTKQCIKRGDRTLTIMEALADENPAKIYVMLGANSIAGSGEEATLKAYIRFLDILKEQHSDSIIYIQSVLPIHEEKFRKNYGWDTTNADIDKLNEALMKEAGDRGFYYLDLASIFKDGGGAMPSDYSPDGIHINSAQYVMWFDYLKTHAIVKE